MLGGAESAAKKEEERLARMLNAKSGSKTSLLKPMALLGPPRPPAVVPPKKGSVLVAPAAAAAATAAPARAPPGGLTAEEIALCKQKFKEADRDNSGKVDQGELVHLLEDLFGSRVRQRVCVTKANAGMQMDKGLVKRLAQMQFLAAGTRIHSC